MDVLNSVKSVLADISSVSPLSEHVDDLNHNIFGRMVTLVSFVLGCSTLFVCLFVFCFFCSEEKVIINMCSVISLFILPFFGRSQIPMTR